MDKVKFDIPAKENGKWGPYISKYPADSGVLPPNAFSINTRNLITANSGQAEKRSGGAIWNSNSLFSGPAYDQYEAVFNTGQRLFVVNDAGTIKASTGNGMFTSIQAGFTSPANFEFATYQSRVYGCNGIDNPITMDITTSYGGVSYSFTTAKTKTMGAQVPVSACTAGAPSAGGAIPVGSHTYKITYVYYNGTEESNGNTASNVVATTGGIQTVALTAIPIGGYGVTARRIYRDNNDGNYLLLAQLSDNTTTTYSDTLAVGATPTAIPVTAGLPPVFKYCAIYLDRLFVIDVTGKNLYWSTAGQPDCFNPVNVLSGPADDVMTAIYVFNGIPYVFGQHTVGTILGLADNQFYYSPLSTTVGCVDNRSIQTRSIVSVPTLMWLSSTPNKGIYYTNGSVVQYLSDFIEDLTFNLAQISYLERTVTQASQSAFQGGTASPGMDLLSNPGTMQTINPTTLYSRAADWAAGTGANTAILGDTLQVPTLDAAVLTAGTLSGGALLDGSNANVILPTEIAYTGEAVGTNVGHNRAQPKQLSGGSFVGASVAVPIKPTMSGVMTSITLNSYLSWIIGQTSGGALGITLTVWNDAVGQPGSPIFTQTISTPAAWNGVQSGLSISLTANTRYWIGLQLTNYKVGTLEIGMNNLNSTPISTSESTVGAAWFDGATWHPIQGTGPGPLFLTVNNWIAISTVFTYTPVSATGIWTSAAFDSHCLNQTSGMTVTLAASYPANQSASVQIQGSPNLSTWTTTDTLSSPNGTVSITGGQYRYWQIVYNLASADDTDTPVLGAPTLKFNTTGTWTSPAILCTADITSLVSLVLNATTPLGTTASVQIRTSADNITYTAYSAIGSATPQKYSQLKVTMTADTTDTTSPSLVSLELDWAVSSNLISSAIDTGSVPAGWGVFQFSQVGLTGTVAFFFRSASTALGLAGASFSAVTNGGFPTSTPLEFCQWKVVMTATPNDIPQVNSVTVNWLLSSGNIVRAASLFFNKSYYLAVAMQGSAANNLLIEYDYQGNWRIHSGATIGTMATYFNDAFYCDALTGKVYNAFRLPTDGGTNIVFDLRTKAFDLGDNQRLKTVRSCKVEGVNTGTTLHVYYSLDQGTTWLEMLNSSGTLGYVTTTDSSAFTEYFIPNFPAGNAVSGRTVIFRVLSSDQYACTIRQISPTLYMRKGKAITEAMA